MRFVVITGRPAEATLVESVSLSTVNGSWIEGEEENGSSHSWPVGNVEAIYRVKEPHR